MNKKIGPRPGPTYGQTVMEHHAKAHTLEDDVIEYRRTMEREIIGNMQSVIAKALTEPQYKNRDFYVVLLMKVEHLGQAARTFLFTRLSCPTPVYKQSVWKYHHFSGSLEFMWSIPDSILYHHILKNPTKYTADKETSDLAKYVILMESGELLEWIKKENGEKTDVQILIS